MTRAFVDCHACACLIHVEDTACPFCGAPQRRAGAPLWLAASLICGLGLADIACEDPRDLAAPLLREQFGASSGGTTTSGTSGTTGTTGTGTGTTIDDSNGDGTTYAGPDETDTIGGTWSSTSGSSSSSTNGDGTTYAGPDETTTIPTTTASSNGDGTTYAGPDELTTTMPPTTGDPAPTTDTGDTSGVTESGEPLPIDEKDGCGCTSPTRSRSGLLGLLGLLVMRRRRSRRA